MNIGHRQEISAHDTIRKSKYIWQLLSNSIHWLNVNFDEGGSLSESKRVVVRLSQVKVDRRKERMHGMNVDRRVPKALSKQSSHQPDHERVRSSSTTFTALQRSRGLLAYRCDAILQGENLANVILPTSTQRRKKRTWLTETQ